ncbi:hypothetical protein [Phormidium sp. CCY1219]|uniref:hypothetical protein n=1 Tax=Phormidium sp. CCY1219 TaxID=2886104 RepID=UPI002D1F0EDC|nr:hypothetical protein [Phormidium sp. CCY1219]MEB3831219.1 hypothetical protein [Phormidium sp. CCY1219]
MVLKQLMKGVKKLTLFRTVIVFAVGGLLGGFIPISTPGPPKVLNSRELPEPRYYRLTGTVELLSTEDENPCQKSADREIKEGMEVLVKNRDRQVIARGNLGKGEPEPLQRDFSIMTCNFPLEVKNLPELSSYIVQLETGKEFIYSKKQLQGKNWKLELTLIQSPRENGELNVELDPQQS